MNTKINKLFALFSRMSVITLLWWSGTFGYSNDGVNSASTPTPFQILKIDFGSRSTAMSQATLSQAYSEGIQNPGVLAASGEGIIALSYRKHLGDIQGGNIFYSGVIPACKRLPTVAAFSLTYLSYGLFDGFRDEYNNSIDGSLNPYSTLLSMGWSTALSRELSVGVSLKGVYEKLSDNSIYGFDEYSTRGAGVDVGFLCRAGGRSRLSYGVLVSNIGVVRNDQQYSGKTLELPLTVSTEVSVVPSASSGTLLALNLSKSRDDYLKIRIATEIDVYKKMVFLRGGFRMTTSDIYNFVNSIGTNSEHNALSDEKTMVPKSDWTIATIGAGIDAGPAAKGLRVDFATELRTRGIPPSFILTVSRRR